MIEFKNVSIKYIEDFYSLLNFSQKINSNTLLIDNNSYGGYAIFRLLSKIDKKYSGDIFLNSVNLKTLKNKELNLCYISKIPVLFRKKSIEKNLIYPLKIRKINKNIINEKVSNSLQILEKANFPKKIKDMNLSELKILSLIRGSLWQPQIILLEDFFEGFDNKYMRIVEQTIMSLNKDCLILALSKSDSNEKFFEHFKRLKL